jgi:hypothetical protein
LHAYRERVGGVRDPSNQEYEEIVGEYEEEVLVQEEFPEPPVADTAEAAPTQGKPRCIALILLITVYIFVVHLRCRKYYENHMHISISTYESY